jgi:hypothetical protein
MNSGVLYFLPFTQTTGLNKNQIEEVYQAVISLTQNKPTPLYVDLKTHIRLNSDEKSFVVSKLATCITACAIKEDNIIIRFVVHSFNHLYKQNVPIKMFKSEEESVAWLLNHK